MKIADRAGRRAWGVLTGCSIAASGSAAAALLLFTVGDVSATWIVALGLTAAAAMMAFTSIAVLLSSISRRSDSVTPSDRNVVVDALLSDDSFGLSLFDAGGRLQLWNEGFLNIYGIPPGQLAVGQRLGEVRKTVRASGSELLASSQLEELKLAAMSGGPAHIVVELRGGRHIKISVQGLPNGGWLSRHEDVTDRQQAEQRFAYLALHDIATGLPNRAAFNDRIVENLSSARSSHASFAVIRLGIDRFKEINDVFGQTVGDAVLAEMARRLAEVCHWGFLARPGGDEFSIVTPPDGAEGAIQEVCRQLQQLCDSELNIDGHRIRIGATAGVSVYPRDGDDADKLVAHADVALYRAKTEQRGTVRLFEPAMDLQIREKRALQRDLAVALERKEFEIHYQPQADTAGEIVGFEALLRWRHPERGMVSPALFVPLAEETGQIGPIDEWVLRCVCAEAASWSKPLAIAVNFSPLDFRRFDVPALILQILLETGLEASRLEIEITEGVLIDDFAGAIAILRKIKNLGVRVAMDDFGAGYSSLSYLQSFPFDKIKIDQAFTRKLETNPESAAIVEAILSLARTLKLPVIAEGVETEKQLAFLARAGCDEVQGYLIGRPQPIGHYRDLTEGKSARPAELAKAG
ncbi:MAG: EAL domain-containing protein [Rhodopseudomonas sp.]|uniref:putative bifunctional diguanylate cyclase/phosphodiesterase n=1 Tax=Rhodopseudomonas sp. TaxID=1078 RepID=UPI0039E587E2